MMTSFTSTLIDISLDLILIAPVTQLPNVNLKTQIDTGPLICFISLEVMRELITPGLETECQSTVYIESKVTCDLTNIR